MYMHVIQVLLFLTENTRTSNDNGFQKSTQILPQKFNQQDSKNRIKYPEVIYEL